ncbi:hypothetical protein LINGRAHAP2_LOCUS22419 [Linum grandiflorum]
MADVMSGRGHGGDGRGNDDDEHRRRAAAKEVTDWYTCIMYGEEWNHSEEKWKVHEWMKVRQDGRRIFVELDSQGVPYKQGGKYLRHVLGKNVGLDHLPLSPESWRAVSDLDKAVLWQNLILPKFCWRPEEEKRIQKYVYQDVGKKWREHRGKIWTDIKGDGKTLEEYIASKPNPDYDDRDWERFVKYRTGTKTVKFSETNKKNRDSQKSYHTHGSKPFNITQQELNQVEKNLADPNIPTEFSPDDAVGRCYQGREKLGRVRHMGFAKTPSAISLLNRSYALW